MAQDEGIFGIISRIMRSWAPPGIRPLVARKLVREYTNAYTAVCPAKGMLVSLILPYSNTEMMNIFLNHLSEELKDYFIVMQVDRATWHTSDSLGVPENIRLIYQPAKSPELNPAEHIWEEIREKYFANEFFDSLGGVIDLLSKALNELGDQADKIRSLTFFPHFNITL